jgi:hypothetical protein
MVYLVTAGGPGHRRNQQHLFDLAQARCGGKTIVFTLRA